MCCSPITLLVEPKKSPSLALSKPRFVKVPCGHCIECLKSKQNEWFVRLWSEFQGKTCLFFTLTYRPEAVPKVVDSQTGEILHSVCAEHLQSTMKRFRMQYERKYGKKAEFKYFIASEYGPKTLRPHYHGIISLSKVEFMPFLLDWQNRFGFTQSSVVNSLSASLRYVTKYAIKGLYDNPLIKQGCVKKNFRLISKKMGYNWIKANLYQYLHSYIKDKKQSIHQYKTEYLDKIIQTLKVNINGFNYKLPKYFEAVLFKNKTRLQFQIKERIQEKYDTLFNREFEQLETRFSFREAVQAISYKESCEVASQMENARNQRFQYLKFLSKSLI